MTTWCFNIQKKKQLCTRIANRDNCNFWTTKYLLNTLFCNFPSKEQNCVLQCNIFDDLISTMKKFPMRCTQSPCLHSYHFAPGICLSIIGPYYMNIQWLYCRMKLKIFFGHINITVSKCFFNDNDLFLKKINNSISRLYYNNKPIQVEKI